MHGIDISNWQAGLNIADTGAEFCIMKATEGTGYIDPYCFNWTLECAALNIPWGFYHFARENSPESEAEFFASTCKDYFGFGLPVLDYEVSNPDNVNWCERFIQRVHDLTGIWCVLYISASRCAEYFGSWIVDTCPLWLAGYPQPYTTWIDENTVIPYSIWPFKNVTIWQFTSSLQACGMNLDANIAYITAKEWKELAKTGGYTPMVESELDMAEAIFHIEEAHEGYDAGDLVYWNAVSGFKYLNHPDCAELIKQCSPGIAEITSSSLALSAFIASALDSFANSAASLSDFL